MSEDFMTQLQLQLREAAEREARRGPARRVARTALVPALAGVALALLVAGVLVAGAWLRGPDATRPAHRDALRIVSNTPLVSEGGWMVTGFGSVWVSDPSGQVLRVDPRTTRIEARIPVAPGVPEVAVGSGAVWAYDDQLRLLRIDPADNRVVARIALPRAGDLILGSGAVWVNTGLELLRIDTQRNVVDRHVSLQRGGQEAASVAWDERSMYAMGRDGRLDRLDIRTGRRVSSARPSQAGSTLAAFGDTVLFAAGDSVAAVDARTGDTTWRRPLGVTRVNGSLVAGGDIWVHGSPQGGGRDRLWRLDAKSGRVLGSITLPEFGSAGAAMVGARLWLLAPGGRLTIVAP
jgi:outer membrane protein assembly factor BamB